MHESIVARFDGSPEGYEAVAGAAEHAFRFNARLISLSVEEGLPKHASTMAEVDEVKRERDRYFAGVQPYAEAIACEHHAALTSEVRPGRLADATARFVAEVDADLVVLGYKRHLRFLSLFIGTTATRVSATANASVLVVKGRRAGLRRQRLLEIYGLK
jgi:nucleotide-binding universal stress UspA family protein